MCGFAGVIAWDERYRCSRETLAKMSAAIAHRGPDGEGFHMSPDAEITPDRPQVALAFRRLAILDPDPRSNQPFTDGRHWLVFNGEIYNFRELKKELSSLRPDYAWRTTGDTEVLLCAYAVWGEKCVEHLNGMFAFAVWDEAEKSLFLARDRMGQKPLYVACHANAKPATLWDNSGHPWSAIAIASEASALLALSWFDRSVDPRSLRDYLKWGFIVQPASIFIGAGQVMPGSCHMVHLNSATVDPVSYGEPNELESSLEHARSSTHELVTTAVARQVISDVPLGCFLSGGIDSSVIAASMVSTAALSGGRVQTFSIGFEDPRYDETEHAVGVAKHLGTDHHAFTVRPDAAADLPKLAATFGEPFGDSSALPTHYLSRETKKFVKVALSGDGGDELFGGYDRYRALLLAGQILRFTSPVPWRVISPLIRAVPGGSPKSTITRVRRFVSSLGSDSEHRYAGYLRLMEDWLVDQLLRDSGRSAQVVDGKTTVLIHHSQRSSGVNGNYFQVFAREPVIAATSWDRRFYLPYDLLTKVDRCSMMHGLEVRSPFMDHELVQFAAGLTTDQLLKGGPKRMLREAFKDDLPAWVFKRKKMGFAVPIGDWFRGQLRPMLRDTLFSAHAFGRAHFDMKVVERLVEEHESQRVDHSQRLYALLMLELWWNLQRS